MTHHSASDPTRCSAGQGSSYKENQSKALVRSTERKNPPRHQDHRDPNTKKCSSESPRLHKSQNTTLCVNLNCLHVTGKQHIITTTPSRWPGSLLTLQCRTQRFQRITELLCSPKRQTTRAPRLADGIFRKAFLNITAVVRSDTRVFKALSSQFPFTFNCLMLTLMTWPWVVISGSAYPCGWYPATRDLPETKQQSAQVWWNFIHFNLNSVSAYLPDSFSLASTMHIWQDCLTSFSYYFSEEWWDIRLNALKSCDHFQAGKRS